MLKPIAKKYSTFIELVGKSASRHIKQGCRVEYVPGLSDETTEEYQEYLNMFEAGPFYCRNICHRCKSYENISPSERWNTWYSLLESNYMSKNRKKAWSTIGMFRGDQTAAASCPPKSTTSQVLNLTQFIKNNFEEGI